MFVQPTIVKVHYPLRMIVHFNVCEDYGYCKKKMHFRLSKKKFDLLEFGVLEHRKPMSCSKHFAT